LYRKEERATAEKWLEIAANLFGNEREHIAEESTLAAGPF
jgi:hypothetical protein